MKNTLKEIVYSDLERLDSPSGKSFFCFVK